MSEADDRNLLLLLFVLCQNLHAFSLQSESTSAFRVPISRNYFLHFGVLAAQELHLMCMHLPPMQKVLGVTTIILRHARGHGDLQAVACRRGVDEAAEPEGEAQASDEERRSHLSTVSSGPDPALVLMGNPTVLATRFALKARLTRKSLRSPVPEAPP